MRSVFLGATGLVVSELALGTQTFGWGADEKEAHGLADLFAEAGGTLFDSSSTYNNGASESILGSWLKAPGHRASAVVATKVFFPTGSGGNDAGLSRRHILQSVEESLRRLQTDFIDLYQAHCWDASTPLEESLRAFDDLVRSGKVRYIGVSNFTPSQLVRALCLARGRGWNAPVSLQAEYSLLVRSTEWELLPVCEEEGLALLAWSPLAGGWLSGKYSKGAAPERDSRVGRADRWDDQPGQRETEQTWQVVGRLREIAAARGRTPSQVAINFLTTRSTAVGEYAFRPKAVGEYAFRPKAVGEYAFRPKAVIPILGARTREQLRENLGSVGWRLTKEETAALEMASGAPLPYPYRFIERYTRRREGPPGS